MPRGNAACAGLLVSFFLFCLGLTWCSTCISRECVPAPTNTHSVCCAYVQSSPRCVFVCRTVQLKYAMLVRTLTCAGLLLIFRRVTVSLSDGCDSDSSSPSPPPHNKAPASLRAAHNQVSWSCDASTVMWRMGTSVRHSLQGFFNVVVSLCVGLDVWGLNLSDTGN